MSQGKVVIRCDSGDPEVIDRLMRSQGFEPKVVYGMGRMVYGPVEPGKRSLTPEQAKAANELFIANGGTVLMRNGELVNRDSDAFAFKVPATEHSIMNIWDWWNKGPGNREYE